MKKLTALIMIMLLLILVTSCADAVDVSQIVNDSPAGFWRGLWHGIIIPISWLISLFSDSTAIYAVNNNGGWYDFGFMIGFGALFSSSSRRRS